MIMPPGIPRNDAAPTLSVSGTASITRKADRASAEEALAALTAATNGMQRAIERLRGTHVSVANMTISQFSLYGNLSVPQQQLTGSAQLDVTANDLASLPGIRAVVASTPGASMSTQPRSPRHSPISRCKSMRSWRSRI
jgi:uncharacterized protein YggE